MEAVWSNELIYRRLAVALAIGLIVGLERGWHERGQGPTVRVAGLRTFALMALLGGLSRLAGGQADRTVLVVALSAVAVFLLAGYVMAHRHGGDLGLTTMVAGLVTFVLGAIAVDGLEVPAIASSVVVTAIWASSPCCTAWSRSSSGPRSTR